MGNKTETQCKIEISACGYRATRNTIEFNTTSTGGRRRKERVLRRRCRIACTLWHIYIYTYTYRWRIPVVVFMREKKTPRRLVPFFFSRVNVRIFFLSFSKFHGCFASLSEIKNILCGWLPVTDYGLSANNSDMLLTGFSKTRAKKKGTNQQWWAKDKTRSSCFTEYYYNVYVRYASVENSIIESK